MIQSMRAKLMVGAACAAILGGLVAAGVLAATGETSDSRPSGLELTETPEATETLEPTEAAEPTEPEDAAETPEADDVDEPSEEHEGLSVPLDSPACAGDPEHPNPHDTDGDGDGCREVEMPDGTMKNLPDPAADAQQGNPGEIGRGDDEHGQPTGEPPFGRGPASTPTATE